MSVGDQVTVEINDKEHLVEVTKIASQEKFEGSFGHFRNRSDCPRAYFASHFFLS